VYGFNPQVLSEADVLTISSQVDEAPLPSDGYVAPGQTVGYTATIENKLRNRHALGLPEVDFPVAVQNEDVEPKVYTLAPRQTATINGRADQPGYLWLDGICAAPHAAQKRAQSYVIYLHNARVKLQVELKSTQRLSPLNAHRHGECSALFDARARRLDADHCGTAILDRAVVPGPGVHSRAC
jgi:hypothetical protein